jgi:hypothetical protein
MAGISRGLSGAMQTARSGFNTFLRANREARAKAALNTLEQNQAKVTSSAADFIAAATTYLPQAFDPCP